MNLKKILNAEVKKEPFPGVFQILLHISTQDKEQISKKVNEIINLINYLSTINRIGLQLEYYKVTPILRDAITVEAREQLTTLVKVQEEKIRNLKNIPKDVLIVCDCLNQAYISAYEPNCFIILWSIIEKIFSRSSEHLLDIKELNEIKKNVGQMEDLKQDKKRLEKFICFLSDKNKFPKENRNKIISKEICNLLQKNNKKQIEEKISRISKIRGKFIHSREMESMEEIRSYNKFFENILLVYIKKYISI